MYVAGTVSGNVRGVARNSTSSAQEQGALVRALLGNKGAIHTYTSSAQELSCLFLAREGQDIRCLSGNVHACKSLKKTIAGVLILYLVSVMHDNMVYMSSAQ